MRHKKKIDAKDCAVLERLSFEVNGYDVLIRTFAQSGLEWNLDKEKWTELLDRLSEDDFYQESHKLIIGAMKVVFNARKPVDVVTLADELEKSGALEKAGGMKYITELATATLTVANYRTYLDIVKRDSVNRRLIRAAQSIAENAYTGPEISDGVAYAEKLVFDISKQTDSSALVDMREDDAYDKVLNKFEVISTDKDAMRGVNSGFTKLDKMTNGFQKSDLIVLAARPGVGKTTIGMNIVEHAALVENKTCAVFSLEMPADSLMKRLLSAKSQVEGGKLRSGNITDEELNRLNEAGSELGAARIYIDDSASIKVSQIFSKCRKLMSEQGLSLIVIDYLQLISGSGKSGDNRQQEVSEISRNLKILAKEMNCPVIALSQLSRSVESRDDKTPRLSDLRESGAIEQDADIVMFLYREEYYKKTKEQEANADQNEVVDLNLAKHRNGSVGHVSLVFNKSISAFYNHLDAGGRA